MSPTVKQVAPGEMVLEGDFTFVSVSQVERTLTRLVMETPDTSVDLASVTHMDTAGLALLIEWLRLAKKQGVRLTFRNLPDSLWAIVRASNLDKWLPVIP